ncbi:MAG: HAMP domain-containing sensor histidine kinase [Bacteroidota bacterium]
MIAVISVALVGLIALQIYLLSESYAQKEQAFDRNVLNALNTVSQQIEKNEAASKIFTVALNPSDIPPSGPMKKFRRTIPPVPGKSAQKKGNYTWIISDTVKNEQGKQMRVEVFHSSGVDTMTSVFVQKHTGTPHEKQTISYSFSTDEQGVRISTSMRDSASVLFRDTTKKRRGEIVARVVDKLFLIETLPLEQRIELGTLDSLIKQSLSSVGISMRYSFRVTVGDGDSVKLANDSVRHTELSATPFKVQLFPNDVLSSRYELALLLPDKVSVVLGEMAALMLMSLLFMTIIIVSFVYSIRVIVLQKRLSLSIIDFINNMTHEFKTPISTIALASEAIAKPEVLKSRPKVLKYTSLIVDENNRMKHQVDKILQMAVLEEGTAEWKISDVNLHESILQAVKNFSLVIEQRNGKITTDLKAASFVVRGDSIHLSNILNNILDNAVKYSSAIPVIEISTHNAGPSVVVRISDNGIGIAKEDVERVFDKYYRVSTGNTHDVKGFGLGLSYVKLIVSSHHGTVSLSSIPGTGTTVEITFPV